MFDVIKEIPLIKNPAALDKVLKELGWEQDHVDSNGWEPDSWAYYTNPDYKFNLIMSYNGFYWDLDLYRADIDD